MNRLSKISFVLVMGFLVFTACTVPDRIPPTFSKPATSPPADTSIPASATIAAQSPAQQVDTSTPVSTSTATQAPDQHADPLTLISQDNIISYVEALTAIQPYSGWRNSATEGEAEALDYVATTLSGFGYLNNFGLELERQTFGVYLATELWETRLYLTTSGGENEVPTDALRGHRHDITQALRFDSDGVLNDSERNPVEVAGQVVLCPGIFYHSR